jgi:hypothetical protein
VKTPAFFIGRIAVSYIIRMSGMEIEYGNTVVDKNSQALGKVDYIVTDSWSGEPRKYMVRREKEDDAVFFTPGQVAEVVKGKVKLSVAGEELEQT